MKKVVKNFLINIIIILAIFVIAFFILRNSPNNVDRETAKCIGENSVLYTQLGCHACEAQEELFGENYKYLNVIDCWGEPEKCFDISGTPTWKIREEKIVGVQSIEELKELTGC